MAAPVAHKTSPPYGTMCTVVGKFHWAHCCGCPTCGCPTSWGCIRDCELDKNSRVAGRAYYSAPGSVGRLGEELRGVQETTRYLQEGPKRLAQRNLSGGGVFQCVSGFASHCCGTIHSVELQKSNFPVSSLCYCDGYHRCSCLAKEQSH
jgi:hypothetical protein